MNTPTPNQPASTSTLRSSLLLLFGVFLSFLFPILNGLSQSYDLSRDFSLSSNPNGVWSYGYKTTLGGAFTLFGVSRQATDEGGALIDIWSKNSYEDAAIYHNGSGVTGRALGTEGVYPPGTVWFLPGAAGNLDTYCVIRFKVPVGAGGNYQLITVTEPYLNGPHSGDTDFHVLHDGAELFGEFLAA